MTLELERRECADFEREVRRLTAAAGPFPGFFDERAPIGLARAPGRLDVMGGIADYSGSLVLELPLAQAAFVAAQWHPEPVVHAVSVDPKNLAQFRAFSLPSAALARADYADARPLFRADEQNAWAAYVAGTVVPLIRECALSLHGGVRFLVLSRVPEGKGVSSSAAIEVASLLALSAAAGFRISGERAASLCQKVENLVVGAPCGAMDQLTSACGERGRLMELLCQPASIVGNVEVPAGIEFFGIDSGVQHAISGAGYADARVAAFMGYRLLAGAANLAVEALESRSHVRIHDPRWGGYLANVTPSELNGRGPLASALPERLSGAEFLDHHGGITDLVTNVDPAREYAVRAATEHAIHEHHRVRLFSELLRAAASQRVRELMGELMYASHASYSACGLGSEGTDLLIDLVRAFGPSHGLYGAKITGGGGGGTVAVLARSDSVSAIEAVAARYTQDTGRKTQIFRGSSAGASALGPMLFASS